MPELSILLVFIPTWFLVSLSPGLCMSLALSLGMTIGLRKTLWMMLGEMLGVAIVGTMSVVGVASTLLQYPNVFAFAKIIGGSYIVYVGITTWRTIVEVSVKVSVNQNEIYDSSDIGVSSLIYKGLITAVLNPKGWAFMIALLPPFFDTDKSLYLQLTIFMLIILVSEFICMLIYASGGKGLRRLLNTNSSARYINKVGGGLLIVVGLWLIFL